jgi:hypothetical protein
MTSKAKIKVIKKNEIKVTEKPVTVSVEKKTSRAAAREMVSTVTNWVTDFQRNKREETKQAFEQLFAAQPQVSEM